MMMPSSPPPVLAPQNARVLKTTEDSVAIGWDQVVDVDGYLISYFPVGYEASVKQVRVSKDQTTYEILGLLPGTKYIITLRNVKKGIASDPELLQASTGKNTKTSPKLCGAWFTPADCNGKTLKK